jgi:hypothetical protein
MRSVQVLRGNGWKCSCLLLVGLINASRGNASGLTVRWQQVVDDRLYVQTITNVPRHANESGIEIGDICDALVDCTQLVARVADLIPKSVAIRNGELPYELRVFSEAGVRWCEVGYRVVGVSSSDQVFYVRAAEGLNVGLFEEGGATSFGGFVAPFGGTGTAFQTVGRLKIGERWYSQELCLSGGDEVLDKGIELMDCSAVVSRLRCIHGVTNILVDSWGEVTSLLNPSIRYGTASYRIRGEQMTFAWAISGNYEIRISDASGKGSTSGAERGIVR